MFCWKICRTWGIDDTVSIIFCSLWLHNSSSAVGSLCASSHFIKKFLWWTDHARLQILLDKNTIIYHTLARKFAIQCTLGINKFFHTRPVLLHIVNSKKNMCSLCKYNMHFSSCYGLLLLYNNLQLQATTGNLKGHCTAPLPSLC